MELRNRKGDDHRRYRLIIDAQFIAQTHVSSGTKYRTLGQDLVAAMAKQLHVSPQFFRDIVTCTKSRDDYLHKLRELNKL
jgi:hypothetical protein